MTHQQKSGLVRRVENLAGRLCERMENGEIKRLRCPGCKALDDAYKEDYPAMRAFIKKWGKK